MLWTQYASLCEKASSDFREVFEGYAAKTVRLDAFYHKLIGCQADYAELFLVVKFVMILSHGNAAVESGFSVNGDMLIENLQEESLVAQRQVYDGVRNVGGLLKVKIDKHAAVCTWSTFPLSGCNTGEEGGSA